MSKLPAVSGKKVVEALKKAGFKTIRQKGSHVFLRQADGRTTTVPVHKNETIGHGLLSKILRDVELDREEFRRLLES